MRKPSQTKIWESKFGLAYTKRSPQSVRELDSLYLKQYGVTRQKMNKEFLNNLDRAYKILEVGANIGLQLETLRRTGFKNLFGIEINDYAIKRAKKTHPEINIIKGSALDIPFRAEYFDLVFTSGVLIHVAPKDLKKVLNEIYRVSSKYIWGFEYYSPNFVSLNYRKRNSVLWKNAFQKLYLKTFPELRLVKEKKYQLLNSENLSQMFLLKKN